jgi:hypothetical protein
MAFMNAGFGARFAPVRLAFFAAFFGAAFFAAFFAGAFFFAVVFFAAFFAVFFPADFFIVFFAVFLPALLRAGAFFLAADLRAGAFFFAAFFGAALFAAGFLAVAFLPDFFVRAIDGLRQRVSLVRRNEHLSVRTKMDCSPCIRNKKICADAMSVLTVILAEHDLTACTSQKSAHWTPCTDRQQSRPS